MPVQTNDAEVEAAEIEVQSEGLFLPREQVRVLCDILVFAKSRLNELSKHPDLDPLKIAKLLVFCEALDGSCKAILGTDRPKMYQEVFQTLKKKIATAGGQS